MDVPRNLAPAWLIEHPVTVPAPADRPQVRVRVVGRTGERWVHGAAAGWTSRAVHVRWSDAGLGRADWFAVADVRRG